jgi:hypothetical protein
MFTSLLNNGVTLLAALLGNLKEPNHLRLIICIVLVFCAVTLVFVSATENNSNGKTPQPSMYLMPIYPKKKKKNLEEFLNKFKDLYKETVPKETEEKPIINIYC